MIDLGATPKLALLTARIPPKCLNTSSISSTAPFRERAGAAAVPPVASLAKDHLLALPEQPLRRNAISPIRAAR